VKSIALPLLVAVVTAQPAVPTGFLDHTINFGGESYRYQVYVPAEYPADKRWPVIVSLHGGGRQGTDGMQQTATDVGVRIRGDRASVPAIVLFPQASPDKRFMFPEMEELVMAELRQTIADFRVDTTRIYLQGNSMGGEGAYRIAYRWPETFAALVVTAGPVEIEVPPYPPELLEIDHRANPFSTATDPFAALAAGIKGIPIWIFHGDSDEVIPVEQARRIVAALKRTGANVRYTEFPGVNHNGTPKKAFGTLPADVDRQSTTADELLKWLFSQHRASAATGAAR
jgi:predicted peptidase